jgi:hypothetical protein
MSGEVIILRGRVDPPPKQSRPLTVAEAIDRLSDLPPNAELYFSDDFGWVGVVAFQSMPGDAGAPPFVWVG